MQITGPTQLVFADGASQASLPLGVSGATGSVQFTVTQAPAQVASVRKSATAPALAAGAVLTAAEAAALVVTRTASSSYGPTINAAAIVGVRTRVFDSAAAAPAFTVGDAAAVQAVKNGNFWIPGVSTGGTGTVTIDVLLDLGTAMTLGKMVDTGMWLADTSATTDQWAGVTARAIASTNGTSVSVLNALSIVSAATNPLNRKKLSATVTGASSGRWVGVRLLNVPKGRYPCIFEVLGVQASTGSGSFAALPSPVTFAVSAQESAGTESAIGNAAVVGVRSRVYATAAAAPVFTVGDTGAVTAVKNGNYWLPDYPTGGTGTLTVDVLLDVGSPITLSRVADTIMKLGYTGRTTDQWVGITAKAIASVDGTAVTALNALTIAPDTSYEPNSQKKMSGAVTGAPSARHVGVRLENVPYGLYPAVFVALGAETASAAGARDEHSVAIGDTSTNFGAGTGTPPPPPPPPPPPSGNNTIYGDPGSRFGLGIYLREPASSYALTVPAGLSLVERVTTPGTTPTASAYQATNASGPFAPAQTGDGASGGALSVNGPGATFDGTYVNLPQDAYLSTPSLGLSLATTANAATTQTPGRFTLGFTGVIPADKRVIAAVLSYAEGGIVLQGNWATNNLIVRIERDFVIEEFQSDSVFSNTALEDVAVRYVDNPGGTGGTISFLRGGVQVGPSQATTVKPRIAPMAALESNALTGNTNGGTNIKVKGLSVGLDRPSESYSYTTVPSGTVSAAKLQALFVDATGIGSAQAAKTVTYQPAGGVVQSLDVVVGPMVVPAGAAYRAVLEDWSSGSAVSHPNMLVMTKAARQNCRFEDAFLYDAQTPWTECLPQGPVPVIGGIGYYCEAIRTAGYVQFQFGYDWTISVMPANPFGDPTTPVALDSYMVPHKWRIEDVNGTVLARIERPDGGPLNGTDIPRIFEGPYNGVGAPMTSATAKWYPHGTVRSGIIWRSGTPTAYAQATVSTQLPRYDLTVPYAGHTSFSNNGGDLRLTPGEQLNGFGNTRVMPFLPTHYAALTTQVGVTQDPYKASLYSFSSLAAVASTWLKYTPFNQSGRSPMTGPGGVRDDRAAVAEPVAQYMYDMASLRPHDRTSFATLALDYLTAYVSDPYHCFEGGRNVPLYKGVNAARTITLRNHYYGGGQGATPPERAYYLQGGRHYEIKSREAAPLRVNVPGNGSAPDKPYFGNNQIDAPHAHQYPHWGSLLFRTPEFAFLGHKFWDQTRLYLNVIIDEPYANRFAERDGAWAFLHAVLAWKTASANSDRLYTRKEVLDFVAKDFEAFSDKHKTSAPGFDNPPTNVFTNGDIDSRKVAYAATSRFGPVGPSGENTIQHDFYIGYWLTALGIAEKLGFNAALRSSSAKAGQVLDFLIAAHRKRIVGRINEAPRANLADDSYTFAVWSAAAIRAAGGNVASLPQTYTALAAQNGNAPSWDKSAGGGTAVDRDGQATDQIVAGPSILKNQLRLTGADIDQAMTTANGWRNQKKTEQQALGVEAGSGWFRVLNAINNPALS